MHSCRQFAGMTILMAQAQADTWHRILLRRDILKAFNITTLQVMFLMRMMMPMISRNLSSADR